MVYADIDDAYFKGNSQAYEIKKYRMNSKSELSQKSAHGGGYAISIMEVDKAETGNLEKL